MTMMNGKFMSALLCGAFSVAVAPVCASGQSIDPTVEVTRDYEGRLMEVHKPLQVMPVPDSLQRFDLEFGYSIYDSPYKGTFDFSPVLTDMAPSKSVYDGKRLLLRLGAGYPLQPVFDFVWSPGFKGRFRMSVYASHRSYVGRYRSMGPVSSDGTVVFDDPSLSKYGGSRDDRRIYSGYDMETRAGVDGSVMWNGGRLSFDVGYYGIAARDTLLARNYDAVDASVRVMSDEGADRAFVYDAALAYRYGRDRSRLPQGEVSSGEQVFRLDASLGPVFSEYSRALLDIDFNCAEYAAAGGEFAGDLSLAPRYVYARNRWNLDLGVRFALTMHNIPAGGASMYGLTRGQFIYPDVRIGFAAVREYMNIYLSAGGGNRIDTWSDLLRHNHRFSMSGLTGLPLGNTEERISARLGLEGNIASRFTYDLSAGYSNFANARFDSVVMTAAGIPAYAPAYSSCGMFRADLDMGWESGPVSADASMSYIHTDVAQGLFAPASLSGYVNLEYNWKKRVSVGADCGFATARHGSIMLADGTFNAAEIPGYADLGVTFEYRTARGFSVWLHGGNLIGMTVQEVPLYAGPGINFTAGICLNL